MTNKEAINRLRSDIDTVIKALEQKSKTVETIDFAIDASNGDTNYFVGFRNGLRYSKSLIDMIEPQFENCTEQEPKKGYWIRKARIDDIYDRYGTKSWGIKYQCNKCGFMHTVIEDGEPHSFCPGCGAKMGDE